jgi:exodeoxyribonuclease V alpha subunit
MEFPRNSEGLIRQVRLLMENSDGGTASAQLPEGVEFGYALSIHKAQGSQFKHVIILAERGNKNFGIVQRSNIYTGVSRAREHVTIVGSDDDFVKACATDETPRETILASLLARK